MGRGFLIFIFMAGMFGCMLSNGASRMKSGSGNRFEQTSIDSAAENSTSSDHDSGSVDGEAVELERNSDGHFYADVQVNGATLHLLVDTGATDIALTRDDARNAGLAVSIGMPDVVGQGADGDVRGELATLDRVTLGEKTVERLPAVVLNSGQQSLLGQSFLSKFESVEIQGDRMLLR
jgi:aspartyl protease family protein